MKHLRQLGLIIIVFTLLLPVIAQDFENQYDFGNNVFIRYPADWDSFIDEGNNTYLYSEKTDMLILFEAYDANLSVTGYLRNLYERTLLDTSQSLDEESIFLGDLGNLGGIASYTYDDNADGDVFQRYIFAIPLAEEIVVLASVTPYSESEIEEIGTVLDILSTLQWGSDETQTQADVATETPALATPTPEPTVDPSVPRNITWDNQLGFKISGTWQAETSEDGINYIFNDDFTVVFFSKIIEDPRQDTRANFLREVYHSSELVNQSIEFDEDLIFFINPLPNDDNALGYKYLESFEGDNYEQLLVAVQSGSTMLVVAIAYPLRQDSFAETELNGIYEILGSLTSP